MSLERRWPYASQAFTANGTNLGGISVADTYGFFVKQSVQVRSNAVPTINLEIKRITGNTIYVGKADNNIDLRTDVSAYLVADSAVITAFEQLIRPIKGEEIIQYVYDREPIVAWRTIGVDRYGNPWSATNPLPTTATISIGSLSVDIDNPKTPTIVNTPAPLAATEYSYTFPPNTKRFSMRVRGGRSVMQISYTAGQSGIVYYTNEMGNIYESGEIDPVSPFTVYFQCNRATQIVEILSWAK
jgi:hypothetical protein